MARRRLGSWAAGSHGAEARERDEEPGGESPKGDKKAAEIAPIWPVWR